jgi:hypothetical protein
MYPNPAAVIPLPPHPSLEQYKKRAKALVKACKSGEPAAVHAWAAAWIEGPTSELEGFIRKKLATTDSRPGTFTLADAQFLVARAHGFKSWPRFARYVEALTRANSPLSQFESAVEAIITGDVATLDRLLRANRAALIRARSPREHQATLLQYVAANGVEGFRQKTPKNAVEVAKLLLDAGADVDALA